MKSKSPPTLDRLVQPLGECLNLESAKRILKLKADPQLQARMDQLARKGSEGTLTPEEQSDYERFVSFSTFVAILKSKARLLLKNSQKVQ